ncbi:glycosyltransferase family 87 protein [Paraburkholderia phymatum]|uniref:glycosyltransferase family 87 protein n=1 Tax=Paraburkholderia phymatum TaxID=148447 RepID=UPI003179A3F5
MKEKSPDTGTRYATYSWFCFGLQFTFLIILIARHYVLQQPQSPALGMDFAVYWSAARVAIEHGAAAIYSPEFMRPLELAVRPYMDYTPWPYPPTFLPFVLPLGWLSFNAALVTFLTASILLYVYAMHLIARPIGIQTWRYSLGFPAIFIVISFGQNSLLTAAIAAIALSLLPTRPIIAGAAIALLSIKPQLGVLFPVALICGQRWKAFFSAIFFTGLYAGACLLTFGVNSFTAFYHALGTFGSSWITQNSNDIWFAMTSIYGVLRVTGVSATQAYLIQCVYGTLALGGIVIIWRGNYSHQIKCAALASATLMVSPYIIFYDLAWLAIAIAFIAADISRNGKNKALTLIAIIAWFLPFQALLARWFPDIYQWSPFALPIFLIVIVRHKLNKKAAPEGAAVDTHLLLSNDTCDS